MKTKTGASARVPIAPADALDIAVVGLGHVGLVTAVGLASFGHRVVGFDSDADRIDLLARAAPPLHEAGLEPLLREQRRTGRLRFSAEPSPAFERADVVFVAVGTPRGAGGAAEMQAIDDVVAMLSSLARVPALVVLKSTVPVGTAQRVQTQLAGAVERPHASPPVVLSNPEFLREGCALRDFLQPDRIVIGDDRPDDAARQTLLRVYAPLVAAATPVLTMDTRSAELTKCAANAMLAARLSLINELAGIALATGADIERVREGIGSDHRIGTEFLRPGIGYGGSCFAKDLAALRETARRHRVRADMLVAIDRVNSRQQCWPLHALQRDRGGRGALRGLTVAVWGLAFKPGTDDMRDAPSLALIPRLWAAGVHTRVYDPAAMGNARRLLGECRWVSWADSAAAAVDGADALLLLTEWPEFIAADPAPLAGALQLRTVYDGRNALDADTWRAAGLTVRQVGRSEAAAAGVSPDHDGARPFAPSSETASGCPRSAPVWRNRAAASPSTAAGADR